jgi:predicted transcriptional regulator
MNAEHLILELLSQQSGLTSAEIHVGIGSPKSARTTKRTIDRLIDKKLLTKHGVKRYTTYSLSKSYSILHSIDMDDYFSQDIDERDIQSGFNHKLLHEELYEVALFTDAEYSKLAELLDQYRDNISGLSALEYQKEIERLAIDLSWKSSQIEGNTYTLLETERLLKDKETAAGKTKDDAVMLLNHKEAIDFVVDNPQYLQTLSVSRIEDIHSILVKELGIDRNLRRRRVGITGTNYRPLANEFQIKEAFAAMCDLINAKANVFDKALLALVLISYIQGFSDGNKRTARITSNALLIAHRCCPLSFRTVNSLDYKKAMLVFYEKNNITPFKRIFIDQFEFAVKTYF